MFKLAFSTLPCDGWTAEKIVEYCSRYGFTGLEIREGPDGFIHTGSDIKEIERVSAIFQASGITITDIGSSICIKGFPAEEKQKVMENMKKEVNLAGALKAKGIRVFLGNFAPRKDSPKAELSYEMIVDTLQSACEEALLNGVEIWVETHNEFSTGKVLKKLLTDVNRGNLKIIWDLIHPLELGESPEETVKYLGEYCAHIHIKDGRPWQDPMLLDWKYTKLGEGILPMGKIVKLLRENGYQGFYSLEWENKWREEIRGPGFETETILPEYSRYMKKLAEEE